MQLLRVDIVDRKNIFSETADGTDGDLLLQGTLTTPEHDKIIV
jgi:hypothetical protein